MWVQPSARHRLTDSYASVINSVSFRIILIGMMVWNLKAKIIDTESLFPHGDLEETIFMEIPSGIEVGDVTLRCAEYPT
jgi:hypothetical protein